MLFVLPVIPWFKIAVPVAVAFAVPKRGLQIAFLAGALLLTLAIDVTTAAPFADQQTDGEELSAIGTLSPMFFKFCIWAAAGLGAFVASRGLDRASNPEREV